MQLFWYFFARREIPKSDGDSKGDDEKKNKGENAMSEPSQGATAMEVDWKKASF